MPSCGVPNELTLLFVQFKIRMSKKKPSTTSPAAYPMKGPFNPATADDILESMNEMELSNHFVRQVEHMTQCFASKCAPSAASHCLITPCIFRTEFRRDYAKDVERRQKALPSKKKRPEGQL